MFLKRLLIFALVAVGAPAILSGCTNSEYVYSAQNRMLTASSHNHFLELGPCGSPWNYDDQVCLLFNATGGRFAAGQLEAYQHGKLKIESGYVLLDLTNKTATIHLTFEGYEHTSVPCKYNGTHRFTLRDPKEGEVSRQWLQDFFKTNDVDFYQP